jgi:hypothetical protein
VDRQLQEGPGAERYAFIRDSMINAMRERIHLESMTVCKGKGFTSCRLMQFRARQLEYKLSKCTVSTLPRLRRREL